MPIFEYENYDDDEIFDFEENEFGDVKNKAPKKVVKVIRKPQQSYFRQQILKRRQSVNVEDRRVFEPQYVGNRLVKVYGYLTRNTWFHLSSRVKYDILSALQSRGFGVIYVAANARNAENSQYNFEIRLRVWNEYTKREVIKSLISTLSQTVALPNSIEIINSYDYG
jgi:hypothetical protein